MVKFNKNSLAFRINLIGLSMMSLIFLFFWANLYLTGQSMEQLERAKVKAAFESQIPLLQDAAFFGFEKPLVEMIRQLMNQKSAIEEIILDVNGKKEIF